MSTGQFEIIDDLRYYVRGLCESLSLPFDELAERVAMKPERLENLLADFDALPASTLAKVADAFDTTVESLMTGAVPVEMLKRQQAGQLVLPNRYTVGATSRLQNLFPALNYLNHRWSETTVRNALRGLGISRNILERPETRVSIRLAEDLLNWLVPRGFDLPDFVEMGQEVAQVSEYEPIRRMLRHFSNAQDLYEYVAEAVTPLYEKNFTYHILRSGSDGMKVQLRPNPMIQEAFGDVKIDSAYVAAYRSGIMSAHSRFAGLPDALMIPVKSMETGDRCYEYDLIY